ncbi:MAG: hypothetical protein AUI11_13210 [Acidobacteria bacterium 13_2_20CM_2_66_4]|nr:MAG: hypothetical protein AUI11_13210 [Acidobacteria bacterium 13_2_20CM_2_66_4]
MKLLQQIHDGLTAARVEVPGWLVREQDERLAGDGSSDGDALLLTARQLTRKMLRAMRHADAFERRLDALLPLGGFHASIGERQLDVLEHGEIANQVEALKDKADLAVADTRALRRWQFRDGPVVQEILAFGRRIEEAEDRQERRLAAARWSGDRHVLALVDLEVNA